MTPDFSKANCKNQPTEWWFPQWPITRAMTITTNQAKKICSECSIKKECLEYGIATQSFGIWGEINLYEGKTEYRKYKPKQKQEQSA